MIYNYFRVHSKDIAFQTQEPRGIFTAIWKLVENGLLSESETVEYWKNRSHFEAILPIPPFYKDGNSLKAVTWYKNTANGNNIFNQMTFYLHMAKRYDLELYKTYSVTIPGQLVYEDEYQIGIIKLENYKSNFKLEKIT